MPVENPFVGQGVGARYARARPALHDRVVDLILARQPRVPRAIDLACGTGLSTMPLLKVAGHVVGLDISSDMLAVATQSERVSFIQGAAEGIPFAAAAFDLATVCSGIHWLRREALGELHRVLKIDGSLVVYDVWFPADMVDEPQFADWMSVTCGPRYPSVPKKQDNLMALLDMGFRPTWSADLRHEVRMDLESLVDYLMTHSERIAAIQDGRETEAEQAEFFEVGLRSLFPDEIRRALLFGISVHAFQCQPSAAAPA